mmetsp:Transcript_18205/g.58034  ORF Transcript_18205/g.58034 Transcript_18205/m.58034 type:complete len:603 (+) Transcript_18205:1120-2928(+)
MPQPARRLGADPGAARRAQRRRGAAPHSADEPPRRPHLALRDLSRLEPLPRRRAERRAALRIGRPRPALGAARLWRRARAAAGPVRALAALGRARAGARDCRERLPHLDAAAARALEPRAARVRRHHLRQPLLGGRPHAGAAATPVGAPSPRRDALLLQRARKGPRRRCHRLDGQPARAATLAPRARRATRPRRAARSRRRDLIPRRAGHRSVRRRRALPAGSAGGGRHPPPRRAAVLAAAARAALCALRRRQPLLRAVGGGPAVPERRADSGRADALLARRGGPDDVPDHALQSARRQRRLRRRAAAGRRARGAAHPALFAVARRAEPGGNVYRPHVPVPAGGAGAAAGGDGAAALAPPPLAAPGRAAADRLRARRAGGGGGGGGECGAARRRRGAADDAPPLKRCRGGEAAHRPHAGAHRARELAARLQRGRLPGDAGRARRRKRGGAARRVPDAGGAARGRAPAGRAARRSQLDLGHRRTSQLAEGGHAAERRKGGRGAGGGRGSARDALPPRHSLPRDPLPRRREHGAAGRDARRRRQPGRARVDGPRGRLLRRRRAVLQHAADRDPATRDDALGGGRRGDCPRRPRSHLPLPRGAEP